MMSRKSYRGHGAGLTPGGRPRRRRSRGKPKSGACSMSLPAAAAQTTVALAQMAAVQWRIRGAR